MRTGPDLSGQAPLTRNGLVPFLTLSGAGWSDVEEEEDEDRDSADTLKDRIYMRQSPSPPHGPGSLGTTPVSPSSRESAVLLTHGLEEYSGPRAGSTPRPPATVQGKRPYAGVTVANQACLLLMLFSIPRAHTPSRGQSGSLLYITGPLSLSPPLCSEHCAEC